MAAVEPGAPLCVMHTPELLELILSHLEMMEIIRLSSTSLAVNAIIYSSPLLKRKLFLSQPRLHDISAVVPPTLLPSHATQFQGPMYSYYLDITLFNPALFKLLPGLTIRDLLNGWLFLSFNSSSRPASSEDASYKSMLLTAQPITKLRLEPAALLIDPSTGTVPLAAISRMPAPDPGEAARIEALFQRLSVRRENSPRFGGPGERAPMLPVQATLRWAAARGEVSSDGWIWGPSLKFVRGKRVTNFIPTGSSVCNESGVRIGDIERVLEGARGWNWWAIRKDS